MRDDLKVTEINEAARAAGRFQKMAPSHISFPKPDNLERDGHTLLDARYRMGLRPSDAANNKNPGT